MQSNQQVTEIVGKPGKVWGTVLIPTKGTVTVRIVGDVLHSTLKSGLEQTDAWTRIQHIDSISLAEAPNYTLLGFGILIGLIGLIGAAASVQNTDAPLLSLLFLGGGIAAVIYALSNKQRLLTINSLRSTIPVFITSSPELYKRFASNVMVIARQLNTSAPTPSRTKPSHTLNGHAHTQTRP